ncbi:hypothetical protein HMPREF2585_06645 [Staphylococcus sp. HMSC062D12]|nr:hypothetical protein HMPREF2585_06645 [Staphylococcus sp. HMSC062D12]
MTYFGETLEGTGQAEDWGPNKEKCEKHFSLLGWLKLSPKKASQQYEVLNKKKHSDELNSIHLSAIFLRFMSQPFL